MSGARGPSHLCPPLQHHFGDQLSPLPVPRQSQPGTKRPPTSDTTDGTVSPAKLHCSGANPSQPSIFATPRPPLPPPPSHLGAPPHEPPPHRIADGPGPLAASLTALPLAVPPCGPAFLLPHHVELRGLPRAAEEVNLRRFVEGILGIHGLLQGASVTYATNDLGGDRHVRVRLPTDALGRLALEALSAVRLHRFVPLLSLGPALLPQGPDGGNAAGAGVAAGVGTSEAARNSGAGGSGDMHPEEDANNNNSGAWDWELPLPPAPRGHCAFLASSAFPSPSAVAASEPLPLLSQRAVPVRRAAEAPSAARRGPRMWDDDPDAGPSGTAAPPPLSAPLPTQPGVTARRPDPTPVGALGSPAAVGRSFAAACVPAVPSLLPMPDTPGGADLDALIRDLCSGTAGFGIPLDSPLSSPLPAPQAPAPPLPRETRMSHSGPWLTPALLAPPPPPPPPTAAMGTLGLLGHLRMSGLLEGDGDGDGGFPLAPPAFLAEGSGGGLSPLCDLDTWPQHLGQGFDSAAGGGARPAGYPSDLAMYPGGSRRSEGEAALQMVLQQGGVAVASGGTLASVFGLPAGPNQALLDSVQALVLPQGDLLYFAGVGLLGAAAPGCFVRVACAPEADAPFLVGQILQAASDVQSGRLQLRLRVDLGGGLTRVVGGPDISRDPASLEEVWDFLARGGQADCTSLAVLKQRLQGVLEGGGGGRGPG